MHTGFQGDDYLAKTITNNLKVKICFHEYNKGIYAPVGWEDYAMCEKTPTKTYVSKRHLGPGVLFFKIRMYILANCFDPTDPKQYLFINPHW